MPKGPPPPEILTRRALSAFCLDTSIVEAAGFRFDEGPLRRLAGQLPHWVQLWMPDIVVREINRHRMDYVGRAIQQVLSGAQDLRRYIGSSFDEDISTFEQAKGQAINVFDLQLQYFLASHNGVILEPTNRHLGAEIFDSYFQGRPPFGSGRDKKHEFPDAASLLILDLEARERDVYVVAVSKDDGWKSYAEQSQRLFCLSSLQELAAMFVSDTPEARSIRKRLEQLFVDPGFDLKSRVRSTIEDGLLSLPWNFKVPAYLEGNVDVAVTEAKLKSYSFLSDAVGLWITSQGNDECIVELPVDVDVTLRVEAIVYRHDSRGEKIDLETVETLVEQRFELRILMEMGGPLQTGATEEMIQRIDVSDGAIDVVLRAADLAFNSAHVRDLIWHEDLPW